MSLYNKTLPHSNSHLFVVKGITVKSKDKCQSKIHSHFTVMYYTIIYVTVMQFSKIRGQMSHDNLNLHHCCPSYKLENLQMGMGMFLVCSHIYLQ
jgi:uncharacterized membrane protein